MGYNVAFDGSVVYTWPVPSTDTFTNGSGKPANRKIKLNDFFWTKKYATIEFVNFYRLWISKKMKICASKLQHTTIAIATKGNGFVVSVFVYVLNSLVFSFMFCFLFLLIHMPFVCKIVLNKIVLWHWAQCSFTYVKNTLTLIKARNKLAGVIIK